MDPTAFFAHLLSIGRAGRFADTQKLPGAGVHAAVLRLADSHMNALLSYFVELDQPARSCFIKAIAAYEDTVGGLGSVTTLHRLLPLTEDPDHAILDWILSNTCSYWYYAHGAKSAAELDALRRARAAQRAESEERELARELAAKRRKANQATANLYNAVRRGDLKAVEALLAIGADPAVEAPDGHSLHDYALGTGRAEIAAILAYAGNGENAPCRLGLR